MAGNMKHVSGFRELDRLLAQLPANVENRVLQKGASAGARELKKSVRANAPVGTGKQSPASKKYKRLKQNIKSSTLKSARQKGQRGARVFTGNAFWGQLIEFGTRYIKAFPWFRPGIESGEDAAINKMKQVIGSGVITEAEKLARQNRVR